MRKVLFVLAIVALSACGSATAPENAAVDTTSLGKDSTSVIEGPVVEETSLDTLKEIK